MAEVTIEPGAMERRLRDSWDARAVKVKAEAPLWVVVWVDPRTDRHRGRAAFAREQLARFNVKAETRSLRGDGSRETPWRGWVVFARLIV